MLVYVQYITSKIRFVTFKIWRLCWGDQSDYICMYNLCWYNWFFLQSYFIFLKHMTVQRRNRNGDYCQYPMKICSFAHIFFVFGHISMLFSVYLNINIWGFLLNFPLKWELRKLCYHMVQFMHLLLLWLHEQVHNQGIFNNIVKFWVILYR